MIIGAKAAKGGSKLKSEDREPERKRGNKEAAGVLLQQEALTGDRQLAASRSIISGDVAAR